MSTVREVKDWDLLIASLREESLDRGAVFAATVMLKPYGFDAGWQTYMVLVSGIPTIFTNGMLDGMPRPKPDPMTRP